MLARFVLGRGLFQQQQVVLTLTERWAWRTDLLVHLTPVQPIQIQEFEVRAVPHDRPRSVCPATSPSAERRAASVSPLPNVRVLLPDS